MVAIARGIVVGIAIVARGPIEPLERIDPTVSGENPSWTRASERPFQRIFRLVVGRRGSLELIDLERRR